MRQRRDAQVARRQPSMIRRQMQGGKGGGQVAIDLCRGVGRRNSRLLRMGRLGKALYFGDVPHPSRPVIRQPVGGEERRPAVAGAERQAEGRDGRHAKRAKRIERLYGSPDSARTLLFDGSNCLRCRRRRLLQVLLVRRAQQFPPDRIVAPVSAQQHGVVVQPHRGGRYLLPARTRPHPPMDSVYHLADLERGLDRGLARRFDRLLDNRPVQRLPVLILRHLPLPLDLRALLKHFRLTFRSFLRRHAVPAAPALALVSLPLLPLVSRPLVSAPFPLALSLFVSSRAGPGRARHVSTTRPAPFPIVGRTFRKRVDVNAAANDHRQQSHTNEHFKSFPSHRHTPSFHSSSTVFSTGNAPAASPRRLES